MNWPGSGAAVPTVINTDVELQGVELTLDYLVTEQLRFGLIYTYREEDSQREAHFNAQGEFVTADQQNNTTPQEYTITMDWSPNWGGGSWLLHMDYIYEENTDPDNEDHRDFFNDVPGYGEDTQLLNARFMWVAPNGRYELALWGKNLLGNDRVSQPGGLTGDVLDTYHVGIIDPLTWGLDAKFVF